MRPNFSFLAMLLGGAIMMAAVFLGTDPANSDETAGAAAARAEVAAAPPQLVGALGEIARARGVDLPQ